MVSLLFHGAMVAALLGTSQLLTLWPPLTWTYISSACAATAAEAAAKRKEIACNHNFFPIAFEAFGPINQVGTDFISALGYRTSSNTDDPRETFVPFQRLSVAIQRFNAVCFTNSFGNIDVEVQRSQPRHTLVRDFFPLPS